MRLHTKFLERLEKMEGARLSGGLLQRGVQNSPRISYNEFYDKQFTEFYNFPMFLKNLR